ncbi:MAG: type II toxin-antitoxin system HigB family toxin [Nostoc sp.]
MLIPVMHLKTGTSLPIKVHGIYLAEVQAVYPQAEAVGNFTVFNIKGNKYSRFQVNEVHI